MPVDWLKVPSAPPTLVDMVHGLAQVRMAECLVIGGAGPASSAEPLSAADERGSRPVEAYARVKHFSRDR